MPATRSRTSTEAPEVAVEEKKTSEATEQQPETELETKSEVKETATEATTETSAEESNAEEKPVEENANGSTEALPSDTNGEQTSEATEEKVENGSAKRKSGVDEAGDAPDSTDLTPKKAKLDAESKEESNGGVAETGQGEEADKQTTVETTA